MQLDKSKELAWMTKPGNNFCAMPFIHMAIEANGDVLPCCMGKPLKGLNIRNKTVGEVFNDPVRKEFIESFKRNEQHPACEVCWKDPHSIRGKFSTSFASIDFTRSIMNGADPKEQLQWLEIKAGNRCNLKCRICGVHNSSAWAKDNHTFRNANNDIKFKDSFAYKLTQSCDWIDDPKFWNDLEQMESLKYLHFMGGEPFMVPEHFQLIQALVDNPDIDTSQTIIGYNTNGTYFPTKENFELYRNFKEVMFALSIDDIGPRFEYQRKIAEWQKVRNNIVNFKKRSIENDYISVSMDPTINMFNIFYLNEIREEFSKLGFSFEEAQEHYVFNHENDCRAMPKAVKDRILEKYKNDNSVWMRSIMKYLISKDYEDDTWTVFSQVATAYDKIRDENFKIVFKEFYELLKPHWIGE